MGLPPHWDGGGEERPPGLGQAQAAAAFVGWVDRHLDKPAAFERLQIGGQGRPVHRQQRRHGADARRLRAIERHQQRKLAIGQVERPQHLIETARHRARRALQMQAQAGIANVQGYLEGQFFAA